MDVEKGKSMKVDEKFWSGLDESHNPGFCKKFKID